MSRHMRGFWDGSIRDCAMIMGIKIKYPCKRGKQVKFQVKG